LVESDVVRARERRSLQRFFASLAGLALMFLVGMVFLAYRSRFFG